MTSREGSTSCEGCPLSTRRRFLGDATRVFATTTAALTIGPSAALASLTRLVGPVQDDEVRVYPIPREEGVTIDRGSQVILVRDAGAVYAFRLRCPHQNTPLRWRDDGWFQCPKHKSKYQPNGEFISGKATRGMDRFAIRRDGRNVIVDLTLVYHQDDEPRLWAAARVPV